MTYILGVNLLPSTGEWAYDSVPYQAKHATDASYKQQNLNANPSGTETDCDISLDHLQSQFPGCTTVALVVAWFGNTIDALQCDIYPSTTFINGSFQKLVAGTWTTDLWRVSSLTQSSPGLIPISTIGGSSVYGGTPADQSVARCIEDLKARGFRVVFYPFILMDASGFPWRGRITYSPDTSSAATAAVTSFLGSATPSQFTRDATNLTVSYSGPPTDWTFRRMILHYANLIVLAGGVDLFLLGSEFRGLETIRGPNWTAAGTTGADGRVSWDYPFVAGLIQLSDDVRSVFDGAGLTKDTTGLHNLISYAADWSDWMGFQHPGANGQWPHLDQLWGHGNIDVVCFDNYLPLSDWTTGNGGLDAQYWLSPRNNPSPWPPPAGTFNGLGLTGQPTLYSKPYLKANIEGGQYFDWFYNDGNNDGRGLDPNGSALNVSLPDGDRLAQARNAYSANQQILANKQLRWWWNNPHQAVYDNGNGAGWQPHGPSTKWSPQSKSICFTEYGFASVDKSTNQPNVFFDPKSTESFTPYWSAWDPAQDGSGGYLPRRDDTLATMALEAIYEYWVTDGNNVTVNGVPMVSTTFFNVWNWDARPFPTFPTLTAVWGDAGNWPAGQWVAGKGPYLPPPAPDNPPTAGGYSTFPAVPTLGWSVKLSPVFDTAAAMHVSGREARAAKYVAPRWEIELTYELLRMVSPNTELQTIVGFFEQNLGQDTAFYFEPISLSPVTAQAIGVGDGSTTTFAFTVAIGAYPLTPANIATPPNVYLNGVLQTSGFTINATALAPTVTFAAAPAAGAVISADFHWYLLCRFDDDAEDAEEFMAQLYALQSLKLRTVRL